MPTVVNQSPDDVLDASKFLKSQGKYPCNSAVFYISNLNRQYIQKTDILCVILPEGKYLKYFQDDPG